ncbi:hypothetical protein AX14_008859 [Amanita brunnescens Koide BX004]|nr:hypothetical protein AX14_008859 [Amanita brunnescens Koide BX004]
MAASTDAVFSVKLLHALRTGDPALIHPFLAQISRESRPPADGLDPAAAALHLAIRCASTETVRLLLSHRAISPNAVHPPGSGTSALHLAASLARADVVGLLLDQPAVDDSLADAHGRTCRDIAASRDVLRTIDDSRALLNATFRSQLHSYVLLAPQTLPSPAGLVALLESPRAKFIDLSYLDDDSGSSLLHEAARRKDLRLIELAPTKAQARTTRLEYFLDSASLRGSFHTLWLTLPTDANHDNTLIHASPFNQLPTLKGYLNKYTNVAKGYSTRWFVLRGGILSYYRHQADETVSSRGSISMKNAVIKSTHDRLRFEVHCVPAAQQDPRGQKWYLKANHPVEAARWVQAIERSIQYFARDKTRTSSERQDLSRRKSAESDSTSIRQSLSFFKKAARSGGSVVREVRDFASMSRGDLTARSISVGGNLNLRDSISTNAPEMVHSFEPTPGDVSPAYGGDENETEDNGSSTGDSLIKEPPYEPGFALHANSVTAQLELTAQLVAQMGLGTKSVASLPSSSASSASYSSSSALSESLSSLNLLVQEYINMVSERENWFRRRLGEEQNRQRVWEESLKVVVKEGEDLEKELRARSRKKGGAPGRVPSMAWVSPATSPPPEIIAPPAPPSPPPAAAAPEAEQPVPLPRRASISSSHHTTDEEDEFFDAIETNNLPNLVVHSSFEPSESPAGTYAADMTACYAGYAQLRTQLAISADNRPSTSLWSVLKHSIGKDLTKISFPVFFNEPTSMLQRMAEDMEFSECLDAAAKESDPLRRIAYVAAFAMSNYSSTIGRIAKPFNPMLSETFEYVRLDKQYRYMSEQVSHHPPISACWAESPLWCYYGEVDAQNKFMGKSFEIRPTGVAHVELLLPESGREGREEREHFSWKKVTTNVSGFILGSPTIDHYGDMVVRNHRTGERCVLTFKPRGWRGKDAFEITGQVVDARGRVAYDIAGRWNSQLVARPRTDPGDSRVFSAADRSDGEPEPEFILLWRNSDKPAGTPFNLTPFAITLNDCPAATLRPYIAPTDCRLRPDQRAFEVGQYELANTLKGQQEEKQRAVRRAREEGRVPAHRPRWFVAGVDADTKERVWKPVRVGGGGMLEYWAERERVFREGGRWKGVEEIFIEEPESIKSVVM